MDAGKRDQLITFQRATVLVDDYGGETPTWTTHTTAWAQVRRGTGAERREAAQEVGSATATFVTDWSPTLEAIKITDRISYRGGTWDITDLAISDNSQIQYTATRSV